MQVYEYTHIIYIFNKLPYRAYTGDIIIIIFIIEVHIRFYVYDEVDGVIIVPRSWPMKLLERTLLYLHMNNITKT